MFKDRTFKQRVLPFLSVDYFEAVYEKLIIRHLKEIGEKRFFEYSTFLAEMALTEKGKSDVLELEKYAEIINIDKKIKDAQEIYKIIREFIIRSNMKTTIIDAYNKIQSSKDYSMDNVLSAIKKALTILPEQNYKLYDYFGELDNRLEEYKKGKQGVIDRLFSITSNTELNYDWCVQRKETVVIAAPPTRGKSGMLLNLLASAQVEQVKSLYISFEIITEIIARRLDANMADISTKDFENNISGLKKKIKFRESNFGDTVKIVELNSKSITVSRLETIINEICDLNDFQPEVIFLDYADLLKANKGDEKLPRWEQLANIYADIVALQKRMGVAIVTASQTGKESTKNIILEMEQMTGSPLEKMASVDKVILLGQTSRMYDNKEFTLHMDKDRNGWSRGSMLLMTNDWDKQKIYFKKVLTNRDLIEMEKEETKYRKDMKSSKGRS
jgi:replicative DNA helicase